MIVNIMNTLSPYYDEVFDSINYVDSSHPIKSCFAGIVGSVGYKLNNAASDLDIVIVYQARGSEAAGIHKLFKRDIPFHNAHLKLIDINFIQDGYENNISELHNYILPHEKFNYSYLSGKRNCKLHSFITELFFCGYVFDNNRYIQRNYMFLSKQLTIYDFLKRQYISALGRLENYLAGAEVRLRSYLYTARDIFAIEHILTKKTFPHCGFLDLLTRCHEDDIKNILTEAYYTNQQPADKDVLLIPPIHNVNSYFHKKLDKLKPELEDFYVSAPDETFQITLSY
jgi:predicted nucleotidyltransferase